MAKSLPQARRTCPSLKREHFESWMLADSGCWLAVRRPVRALVLQNHGQKLWAHYAHSSSCGLARCCTSAEQWRTTGCTLFGRCSCKVTCTNLKSPQNETGKVKPHHFKILPPKRKARNGWVVTDGFSGNETGLWEKTVHQRGFGQFCQNRLWQKMFCVFFLPKGKWKR